MATGMCTYTYAVRFIYQYTVSTRLQMSYDPARADGDMTHVHTARRMATVHWAQSGPVANATKHFVLPPLPPPDEGGVPSLGGASGEQVLWRIPGSSLLYVTADRGPRPDAAWRGRDRLHRSELKHTDVQPAG